MHVCAYEDFIYLFLERGEGRRKERNIDVQQKHLLVTSLTLPKGGPSHNPGMCPEQELNQQPFHLQDDSQPTEPHWSGYRSSYTELNHILSI